jgi:hypothetical protein
LSFSRYQYSVVSLEFTGERFYLYFNHISRRHRRELTQFDDEAYSTDHLPTQPSYMLAIVTAAADATKQTGGWTTTMDIGSLVWALVVLLLVLPANSMLHRTLEKLMSQI